MSTLTVKNLKGMSPTNLITLQSGHKLYAPGGVVQVQTATTGFVRQTISSSTPVAITNLSVTITPVYATSNILIMGMISGSWTYVTGLHIYRNGSDVTSNHGGNDQTGGSNAFITRYHTTYGNDSTDDNCMQNSILFQDSPNSTSALTYQFYINSGWSGGTSTFRVNDRNNSVNMLSTSYITAMEIAQ